MVVGFKKVSGMLYDGNDCSGGRTGGLEGLLIMKGYVFRQMFKAGIDVSVNNYAFNESR